MENKKKSYYEIIKKIPHGILITRNGIPVFVNEKFAALSGYRNRKEPGKDLYSVIYKDDRQRFERAQINAVKSTSDFSCEFRMNMKSGGVRWFEARTFLIEWKSLPCVFNLLVDRTEKKAIEQKISMIYKALQISKDSVIITDLKHKIIECNEATLRVHGIRSRKEILGRSVLDFMAPGLELFTKENIRYLMRTGTIGPMNVELFTIGKGRRDFEISGAVLEEPGKGPTGMLYISRDISEKEKLRRQLEELNELTRLLNRILGHDISNKLSVIEMSLEMFLKNGNKALLKDAVKQIDQSKEIIGKIGNLERYLTKNRRRKRIDLKKAIAHTFKHFDIPFRIKGDAELIADETLYSLFENIVSNAVIHGKSGMMTVDIEEDQKGIIIVFCDHGIGMKPSAANLLISQSAPGGEITGRGIGFLIIRKTMERLGGTLKVSVRKRSGTVVELTFPKGVLQSGKISGKPSV